MPSVLSQLPSNFEARQNTLFFFWAASHPPNIQKNKIWGDIQVEPEEEEAGSTGFLRGKVFFGQEIVLQSNVRGAQWRGGLEPSG